MKTANPDKVYDLVMLERIDVLDKLKHARRIYITNELFNEAAENGLYESVEWMIENVHCDYRNNNDQPLRAALGYGHTRTCDVLLNAGADAQAGMKEIDELLTKRIIDSDEHMDLCYFLQSYLS